MEFKDIISISGMPGLFSLVATKSNGLVVKSLEDGKSTFVSSRIHGVSSLDNISVFLSGDDTMELKKVLIAMKEQEPSLELPGVKADPEQLKVYFRTLIPEYDEERVHLSDMKKMIRWYHIMKEHNLIPEKEEEAKEEEAKAEAGAEEKPEPSDDEQNTAAAKKQDAKKEAEETSEEAEEVKDTSEKKPKAAKEKKPKK